MIVNGEDDLAGCRPCLEQHRGHAVHPGVGDRLADAHPPVDVVFGQPRQRLQCLDLMAGAARRGLTSSSAGGPCSAGSDQGAWAVARKSCGFWYSGLGSRRPSAVTTWVWVRRSRGLAAARSWCRIAVPLDRGGRAHIVTTTVDECHAGAAARTRMSCWLRSSNNDTVGSPASTPSHRNVPNIFRSPTVRKPSSVLAKPVLAPPGPQTTAGRIQKSPRRRTRHRPHAGVLPDTPGPSCGVGG